MDRAIVYTGALPQTTDILNTNVFTMVDQAFQNLAMLGSSTVVAGLTCTPTSPTPNLNVVISPGSIFTLDPIDANAYGDLGTNANTIMKQAIVTITQSLAITPPSTGGFSQVYLVQAILNDIDTGTEVVNYYNSSNPNQPFSGPANSGSSQFSVRQCFCAIALKAGVAAATGSQVTPSPDLGYTGLYAITVSNGQTQITSPNIVQLTSAPFFPTLPSVPGHVLKGDWVWGVDTGSANACVVTTGNIPQPPNAYIAGFSLRFKAANANTGATTINVNGIGTVNLKRATGAALSSGDIVSGQIVMCTYDGVGFQMDNYLGVSAGSTTNNFTSVSIPYVADTGTTNALIGTYSPPITSGQQIAGLMISIKLANSITGAATINVNGLGVKNLNIFTSAVMANPTSGVFGAGEILILMYDGTEYQIVTSSGGTVGPQGPAGPTGPAGTTSTSPGAFGTYAFGFATGPMQTSVCSSGVPGPGGISCLICTFGFGGYGGTWQLVSQWGNPATDDWLYLAQRIA